MVKRVFIVHGWGGSPEEGWFPWLKGELEKKGFVVNVLAMPDTDHPKIEKWVSFIAKAVGKADKDTFFVGHSIGCQTILRYAEKLNSEIGGVVFVGGWFSLHGLETDEEKAIAKAWLETPVDLSKVKSIIKNVVAIFSDNDPWVPLDNVDVFKEKLGAKIIIEKKKNHFSGSDNIKELPSALNALLSISK